MPHDKIRDAARRRMAETGESYNTARRKVIKAHQEALRNEPTGTEDGQRDDSQAQDDARKFQEDLQAPLQVVGAQMQEQLAEFARNSTRGTALDEQLAELLDQAARAAAAVDDAARLADLNTMAQLHDQAARAAAAVDDAARLADLNTMAQLHDQAARITADWVRRSGRTSGGGRA